MKAGLYKSWIAAGSKPAFSVVIGSRCWLGFNSTESLLDPITLVKAMIPTSSTTYQQSVKDNYMGTGVGYSTDNGKLGTARRFYSYPSRFSVAGSRRYSGHGNVSQGADSLLYYMNGGWGSYTLANILRDLSSPIDVTSLADLDVVFTTTAAMGYQAMIPNALVITCQLSPNSRVLVIPMAVARSSGLLARMWYRLKNTGSVSGQAPMDQTASLDDWYQAQSMLVSYVDVSSDHTRIEIMTDLSSANTNTYVAMTDANMAALYGHPMFGYDLYGRRMKLLSYGLPTWVDVVTDPVKGVGVAMIGAAIATPFIKTLTDGGRVQSQSELDVVTSLRKMTRLGFASYLSDQSGPSDVWAAHPFTEDVASKDEFLNQHLGTSSYTFRTARDRIKGLVKRVFAGHLNVSSAKILKFSWVSPKLVWSDATTGVSMSYSEAIGARMRGATISAASSYGTMDTDVAVTEGQRAAYRTQVQNISDHPGDPTILWRMADGTCGLTTGGVTGPTWATAHATPEMSQFADAVLQFILQSMTPFSAGDLTPLGLDENASSIRS